MKEGRKEAKEGRKEAKEIRWEGIERKEGRKKERKEGGEEKIKSTISKEILTSYVMMIDFS